MRFALSVVPMKGLPRRRTSKCLAISAVAWVIATSTAYATTFVRMDEADLRARSVAAVVGDVTRIEAAEDSSTGGVDTYVHIEPERVLFGDLPAGEVVLRETGGRLPGRVEWIFGSPRYAVGERVLAFLSQNPDGTLRTTGMAMGKYTIHASSSGASLATRDLGDGVSVLDPASGRWQMGGAPETRRLASLAARLRTAAALARAARPVVTVPPELSTSLLREEADAFTYLGDPSRWFEPDSDLPVPFKVDLHGDDTLGPILSRTAADEALAAWTAVPASRLELQDAGLTDAAMFAGCGGENRIVFNDPFNEIAAPDGCRGVLAVGGFCVSDRETRTVNGTSFQRIVLGKVTLANGWADCSFWNECNVAEVLTHEIGHAIGLGHSEDQTATMAATAHFDGRCAGLAPDDVAAVSFIYPSQPSPTPSWTAPPAWTPTPTGVPTSTATFTPASSPTVPTFTRTPAPTRTGAATATPTEPVNGVAGRIRYVGTDTGVPGVTVRLLGNSPRSADTASAGVYAFAGASGGSTVQPAKSGDLGSGVSSLDAAYVLQAVAGTRAFDAAQALACDVTGNGTISSLDAARILQFTVGVLPRFDVAATCQSDWAFLPAPAAAPNQEVVPPLMRAGSCQPGAITFVPLQGYAAGQDFDAVLFGDCTRNWRPSAGSDVVLQEAPAGTMAQLGALRRVRGGRWRVPVSVRAPEPFHALDLQLRYDYTQLRLLGVRAARSDGATMVSFGSDTPGRIRIALASGRALPGDGRAFLVADFASATGQPSARLVRPYFLAVDERVAPVAGP